MLLTSVASVREPLGFDDMTDINSAIELALNAVEPQIEAKLGTRFDRETVTDVFWVREPGYMDGPHFNTEFRLSRGFVTDPIVIAVEDFTAGSFIVSPGPKLQINRERGIIKDFGTRFHHATVTVTYESGFDLSMDGISYDLDQVPRWLQELAKLMALRLLASNPTVKDSGVEMDTTVLDQQAAALINKNQRYAPSAILPL